MRYLGPVGIVLGLVGVVVGVLLQINGAAAAIFCSTIGTGIVLILLGGGFWLVTTLRHHTSANVAA